MKWKDVSTFSQTDKIRTPNAFQAKAGIIEFNLHRHIFHPGEWLLSCRALEIDKEPIGLGDLELAKKKSLRRISDSLTYRILTYENALKRFEGKEGEGEK